MNPSPHRISWPHNSLEVKVAEQNSSVGLLLESSWRFATKVTASCDVSSPIEILSATVEQVALIRIQFASSAVSFGCVVNDCSVWANTGYSFK